MESEKKIIEVDGSTLEGGGQILRMASAFSAILGIPIKVTNIRAGRSKPGLMPQHLKGLQVVRDLCHGHLEGATIGSTSVVFHPGELDGGRFLVDTQTAGSVSLLIQAALPCALYGRGPTELQLKGGTNADMAPPVDYTMNIFQRLLAKFKATFNMSLKMRGFYPKGGGRVLLTVQPLKSSLCPVILLDPGNVTKISGSSFVAGVLPIKVSHVMADCAEQKINEKFPHKIPVNIRRFKEGRDTAFGNGAGVILWAETDTDCILGGCGLGKKDYPAERVGEDAASELLQPIEAGACIDQHAQDQLIIYMTLAKGTSQVRTGPITLHTKTAMYVAELMAKVKFRIKEDPGFPTAVIECDGIGR